MARREDLPLDEFGLVIFEAAIDGVPPLALRGNSTTVWARLWDAIDKLEIQERDTKIGEQKVRAGFSAWLTVTLGNEDQATRAKGSASGYTDRQRERYRTEYRKAGSRLFVRKMRPELWGERLTS